LNDAANLPRGPAGHVCRLLMECTTGKFPDSPVLPVIPVAPVAPASPMSPRSPFSPDGPFTPGVPVAQASCIILID